MRGGSTGYIIDSKLVFKAFWGGLDLVLKGGWQMREIKFRGKSVISIDILDDMGVSHDNGEWVYGSLLISEHQEKNLEPLHYFICPLDKGYHRVIPETVGQYTGLKDKFGQEIYEGDLAKWVDSDGVDRVDVVRYSRIGAKFFICNRLFEINDYYPVKIIGNIHENPELLKEVR